MKNMKKMVAAAALAFCTMASPTAFAGEYTLSWGVITEIEDFGNNMYVHGLNLTPNPAGCAQPYQAALAVVAVGTSRRAQLMKTLRAAFLAGRQVRLKLHATECSEGRPTIYGVHVK